MRKVCHMSSVHSWNDIRIFLKECQSLASVGYEVYLVVEGIDREVNGVHIIGCGEKPESRKERMWVFAKKYMNGLWHWIVIYIIFMIRNCCLMASS